MKMFGRSREHELVLAEHSRWIAKLRDAVHAGEQRLRMLEQQVSALEGHLAELMKLYEKLDAQLAEVRADLIRLNSKVDALAGVGT